MHPFLLLLSMLTLQQADRPAALRAMAESRKSAVSSGVIDWRVTVGNRDNRVLQFVTRFARNGDRIVEQRGDAEGWTMFDPETGRGNSRAPIIHMVNADGEWEYRETAFAATLHVPDGTRPAFNHQKNLLAAGVHPLSRSVDAEMGMDIIWQGVPGTPYSEVEGWVEREQDGKKVVTAQLSGGAEMTWWIDPRRGWNAERVALLEPTGQVTYEARCELQRYGDIWLPATTRYYRMGELTDTIQIASAKVNQPGDPARFTPADIGMKPGYDVNFQNGPNEPGKPNIWNGERVCSRDDWEADVASGRRQWAPEIILATNGQWVSPYATTQSAASHEIGRHEMQTERAVRKHEGLWEQYVRDFIARYKLNEDQSQQAWNILKQCQQDAERTMEQLRPRLTALEQRLEDARRKSDKKEIQRIETENEKLREPIGKIFETSLKPRLERIPTRAQRQAAPTSAPAKPAP